MAGAVGLLLVLAGGFVAEPTHAMVADAPTHADSAVVAMLYFDQGVDEYNPGRLDSALVMFEKALVWDPKSAAAWPAQDECWGGLKHDPRLLELTK
jgi:Tfp pilus assembly protein PilF